MKYKAILFDMDGVLIESEFLMRASAIHALKQYGIDAKHEDFVEFTGLGVWLKNTAIPTPSI